jgi:small subunit ribosomal protein S17
MALKEKVGVVVSIKMQKTIVVLVENKFRHPRYAKTVVQTKRYLAHDETNQAKLGDRVVLLQSRPFSRHKHWILKQIVSQSNP